MKVTVVLEPKPITRPGLFTRETVECDSITRYEQDGIGAPRWCVFHGTKTKNGRAKSEYRILESIIREVIEEEF